MQQHVELQERLSSLERTLIDHKRLEVVLSRSAGQKEAILDRLKEPVAYHNRAFRLLWVNLAGARFMGKKRDRLIGMHCYEAWEGRSTPCGNCPLERGKDVFNIDGGTAVEGKIWRRCGYPVHNKRGGIMGVVESADNVTELEKARQDLERERGIREALMQEAPAYIVGIDEQGHVRMMNRTMREALGYAEEDVTGRDYLSTFVPESGREAVAAVFEDMRVRKRPTHSESKILTADGREFLVQWQGMPVFEEDGAVELHICMGLNVTETRRLESQLFRAQKLEAVGTLAGGIAHDFNNLLQAIRGYTDLLLLQKDESHSDYQELREIQRAACSASELTEQLLTFTRKVKRDLKPLDINRRVEGVHRILKRTIPRMIAVELRLDEEVDAVKADPAQVEQVLMNLALNARDAMPDGGVLRIETGNVRLDRDFCDRHVGAGPGRYVRVRISDTGEGIDPSVEGRIFEPFFTTKESGKGSGLGLAMVYGIMKNHRGCITCTSEPGQGTAFEVYWPVACSSASLEVPAAAGKLPGGNEVILLVDDDRNIRELGLEILVKFGYEVLVAEDGEQALDLYERACSRVDLIILDLIMPGMGGMKCMKKIMEKNQKAKVLVASGYSPSREEALQGLACGFIRKPYDIGSMLHTIREVLDKGDVSKEA